MISTMQAKLKKALFTAGSIVFWVLLWHIAATFANKNLLFKIPLPLDTLREFLVCVKLPEFWGNVGTSLWHIISGFALAVTLGFVCGLLSGSSTFFATLTAPLTRLIRAVPVAAFIILAWLWIPSEVIPAFIAFLMVFPIVWSHVETGLLSVDKRLVEMARVMGMDKKGIIKNITVPAVMPQFRVSCITGLGYAWKSGVAAEVICNPTGSIGAMLSIAKSNLEYARVFAIVLTVVLLSLVLENAIKVFWKEGRR
ncbi:MAG: ABC transporter permease subunit [Ruminococcaceae bacterium]|nr:ABC transporter permease subunit [Oscillospiraceae bacterium]